jgi:serine/threonine protein kinase
MALDYAHNLGHPHGDIRPANILIGDKATSFDKIKLTGFSSGNLKRFGGLKFSAPEVINDLEMKNDTKKDIWSVGVLTYLLLSGDCPFLGIS